MKNPQESGSALHLEAFARRHPYLYRMQVVAFGVFGYAYLLVVLAFAFLVLTVLLFLLKEVPGRLVIFKLVVPVAVFIFIMARSFWVKLEPPAGMPLTRASAPLLVAEIGRVRKLLRGPRVHAMLLTDELNAAVAQVPRLGLFGWPRNYVIVGLPLLGLLSPEEFGAVLGHEFGHLSRSHGRASAWVFRIMSTWERLVDELARRAHIGSVLVLPFFRWYVPRFFSYASVLSRQRERVADAEAAAAFGAPVLASALARLTLGDRLLDRRFWPGVDALLRQQDEPPADNFSRMLGELHRGPEPTEAQDWLREALLEPVAHGDSHPPLGDRISSLGEKLPDDSTLAATQLAERLTPVEETAAEHFLAGDLRRVLAERNGEWKQVVTPNWRQAREAIREEERRVRWLEAQPVEELTDGEAALRLKLTASWRGAEVALALARELPGLVAGPEAQLVVGRLFAESEADDEAIAWLERVTADGPVFACNAWAVLAHMHARRGEEAAAAAAQERADQLVAEVQAIQQERAPESLSLRDHFEPHGLPASRIAILHQRIEAVEMIETALLVRKTVKLWPERPLFVLAVDARWSRYSAEERTEAVQRLVDAVEVPGDLIVVALEKEMYRLRDPVYEVNDSDIFLRAPHAAGEVAAFR